jgi:hypothetical protein
MARITKRVGSLLQNLCRRNKPQDDGTFSLQELIDSDSDGRMAGQQRFAAPSRHAQADVRHLVSTGRLRSLECMELVNLLSSCIWTELERRLRPP